jgi:hypothetical protein
VVANPVPGVTNSSLPVDATKISGDGAICTATFTHYLTGATLVLRPHTTAF